MQSTEAKTKILYIHHGSGGGGAPLSLLYLIQELDREKYEPIVACDFQQPSARELFRSEELEPYDSKARSFPHTQAGFWPIYSPRGVILLVRWLFCVFPTGRSSVKSLVRELSADIVHLNSLTLLPYAPTIRKAGAFVVLHVREAVADGLFGVRRAWLRWLAQNNVDALIYICEDNKSRLTGEHPKGKVIYNFADFSKFDRYTDQQAARESLKIRGNSKVLLFPGGSGLIIKGILPLLDSLAQLRKQFRNLICLMPGSVSLHAKRRSWLKSVSLGPTANEQIESRIKELELEDTAVRTPFSYEIEKFYAAADVVVAPFTVPHFARAVIESGAMAKPIVASRIGGLEEVVKDGETGLLVEPGDAADLTDKITMVLNHPTLAQKLGECAYVQACRLFDAKHNAAATMQIYKDLFSGK